MQKFVFTPPNEIRLEGNTRYKIIRNINPWASEGVGLKVSYQVMAHMYGPWNYKQLQTCHTLLDAIDFLLDDAKAPEVFVVDSDGELSCRWCGLRRSYLEGVPAWWFGCNLCETEMDKHRPENPDIEKVVYEELQQ